MADSYSNAINALYGKWGQMNQGQGPAVQRLGGNQFLGIPAVQQTVPTQPAPISIGLDPREWGGNGGFGQPAQSPLAGYLTAAAQDPRISGMRMNSAAERGQPEEMARYQQRLGQRTDQLAEQMMGRDVRHATAATRNDLQGWLGQNGPFAWWSPGYREQQQQAVSGLMNQFNLTPQMLQGSPRELGALRPIANLYQQSQRPVANPATVLPPWAGYQSGTGIWQK